MNTFQRVIKYVAIGFAIFLTVSILSGIVAVATGVFSIFGGRERNTIDYSKDFSGIEQLDINNKVGRLIVKPGSGFRVEATNVSEDFRAEVINKTLKIEEPDYFNNFLWFNFGTSRTKAIITVYVPEDFEADRIDIDSGAGEVELQDLNAQRLIINAGVGDIYGENLTAMKVEIDGGVGNMDLVDVNFTDVDFDSGVGNIRVKGMIFGKSDFDCGVGNVRIQLNGARDDYALDVNSGLGKVTINGSKVSRDYKDNYKTDNIIRISGGVGDVDVVFIN